MADETETARRMLVAEINQAVESDSKFFERARLEQKYGDVWDIIQLGEVFEVHGFMAPFCVVTRKSDGVKGSIMFQDRPRFYFGFSKS